MSRTLLPQSEKLYYQKPEKAVNFASVWNIMNDLQKGLIGVYEAIDTIQTLIPGIPVTATTKGDIVVWDGTAWTLFAPGPDRDLIGYDSTSPTGLSSYTPADIITNGLSEIDTDTVDLTLSGANLSADVRMQMSITSDVNGVMLDGDAASPGNDMYYGTDSGGVKGFHAVPAAPTGLTVNEVMAYIHAQP